MSDKYILEGHEAVPEPDLLKWARWFETANREVRSTLFPGHGRVSTVFLGLDHNHIGEGPLLLFETLVFEGPLANEMSRYSTWAEAEAGHDAMVKRVEQSA